MPGDYFRAGLILIAAWSQPELIYEVPQIFPTYNNLAALAAISGAGLLAFFAFIGFEDIVNILLLALLFPIGPLAEMTSSVHCAYSC